METIREKAESLVEKVGIGLAVVGVEMLINKINQKNPTPYQKAELSYYKELIKELNKINQEKKS